MIFTEEHNLKRHCSRRHENKGYFEVKCEECSLVFLTRKYLKQHLTDVHNRKLYVCHICSKSFAQHNKLQLHLESSVHNKNFICQICQISFNNFNEFRKHKKEHTLHYKRMYNKFLN